MAHMCSFISCNYVPFCVFVFVRATIGCIVLLCIVLFSLHFVIFFAFLFFLFLTTFCYFSLFLHCSFVIKHLVSLHWNSSIFVFMRADY